MPAAKNARGGKTVSLPGGMGFNFVTDWRFFICRGAKNG
jgi:hypothetical protein